ncbi:MAG: hypothetical protein ACP5OC_01985 [Thermoplasmata archaeon]
MCGKIAHECYTSQSQKKRKEYYELTDVKRAGGKTVQKHVGYQGRNSIGVDIIENDLKLEKLFPRLK